MPRRAPLIVLGIVAFVVLSAGVARWLTRENRERDAVVAVLEDQARGDAAGMLERLDGCADDAGCRSLVAANARRLQRSGTVKILTYDSTARYALAGKDGQVRVAWDIGTRGDTVVQCVAVRRTGIGFLGGTVELRGISAPIAREGSCPS